MSEILNITERSDEVLSVHKNKNGDQNVVMTFVL